MLASEANGAPECGAGGPPASRCWECSRLLTPHYGHEMSFGIECLCEIDFKPSQIAKKGQQMQPRALL